jgi:LPS-assembly lipoprotein
VLGAAAALTGCGFQLRQTGDYPFKTLFAGFSVATPLGAELSRQLRGTGKIELLTDAPQAQQTDVVLEILQEQHQRVVVGTNASGQVRELQLRLTVKFRLRTPDGVEWFEPVELYQQRDLSFNETAALSKEIEEAMLYRDMQNDIVQQIVRRLSRVKPPVVR